MLRVNAQSQRAIDETYTIPVGKTSSVRDHYNSPRADFEDASGRKLSIEVRALTMGSRSATSCPRSLILKDCALNTS